MRLLINVLALFTVISGLVACVDKAGGASKTEDSPVRLVASIQDIMASEVDPAADALWESVSSTSTANGSEDKQPHTDEEWKAVRQHAITLIEAANLLVLKGRLVAEAGKKVEDSHVAGILTPEQIQKKIDADPAKFAKRAQVLQDYAIEALTAIDAKNPAGLLEAGGKLDHACEQCHLQYWYPDAVRPVPPKLPLFESKKS